MGIPEEGEDGGGSGTAGEVIMDLIPEIEVKYVILGRIWWKKGTAPKPLRIKLQNPIGLTG